MEEGFCWKFEHADVFCLEDKSGDVYLAHNRNSNYKSFIETILESGDKMSSNSYILESQICNTRPFTMESVIIEEAEDANDEEEDKLEQEQEQEDPANNRLEIPETLSTHRRMCSNKTL